MSGGLILPPGAVWQPLFVAPNGAWSTDGLVWQAADWTALAVMIRPHALYRLQTDGLYQPRSGRGATRILAGDYAGFTWQTQNDTFIGVQKIVSGGVVSGCALVVVDPTAATEVRLSLTTQALLDAGVLFTNSTTLANGVDHRAFLHYDPLSPLIALENKNDFAVYYAGGRILLLGTPIAGHIAFDNLAGSSGDVDYSGQTVCGVSWAPDPLHQNPRRIAGNVGDIALGTLHTGDHDCDRTSDCDATLWVTGGAVAPSITHGNALLVAIPVCRITYRHDSRTVYSFSVNTETSLYAVSPEGVGRVATILQDPTTPRRVIALAGDSDEVLAVTADGQLYRNGAVVDTLPAGFVPSLASYAARARRWLVADTTHGRVLVAERAPLPQWREATRIDRMPAGPIAGAP